MENRLLLYVFVFLFLTIGIPILFEYAKNKFMKYIYDTTKKQKKEYKQQNKNIDTANPLYLQAKMLFNTGMKSRSLKRQDILDLTDLLRKAIGKHIKVYNKFNFKNDAHRIYVYLKSKEISIADMQKIIVFLEKRLSNEYNNEI